MRIIAALTVLASLTACGLSESTLLTEMTVEDFQSECESTDMPAKTVTCTTEAGDIEMTAGGTVEECQTATATLPEWTEACVATLGDYRACTEALYADPCAVMTAVPTECTAFFACLPAAQ